MPTLARHVEFTARPGSGDELEAALLRAAEGLQGRPGLEAWIVSRVEGSPDVVVVDERWTDAAAMDAALPEPGDEALAAVMAALDPETPPRRLDLRPAGGPGLLPPPRPGVTHASLLDAEDQAAAHGFGAQGASRFPAGLLGLERTGIGHHRMPAGARSAFGHRHATAEEVYVVLAGSGTAAVGEETVALAVHDALRVAPDVARAFEAGPDGLELLAVGPRHPGDGEVLPGWFGD
ncbi:antibiotic biosynthesis monooxygenase [Patulibacter sp. SYSU D01012]|uniref:antibiotic biosynthesis monooxygenase n=1 Tax=Patulibacter sp. SYSU D01012 TaxID=2817381 RepID=UPI001B310CCE|nr:antibiotic biosynthesis monooxygenase [Patulibacter sp. SYSU D01012]